MHALLLVAKFRSLQNALSLSGETYNHTHAPRAYPTRTAFAPQSHRVPHTSKIPREHLTCTLQTLHKASRLLRSCTSTPSHAQPAHHTHSRTRSHDAQHNAPRLPARQHSPCPQLMQCIEPTFTTSQHQHLHSRATRRRHTRICAPVSPRCCVASCPCARLRACGPSACCGRCPRAPTCRWPWCGPRCALPSSTTSSLCRPDDGEREKRTYQGGK